MAKVILAALVFALPLPAHAIDAGAVAKCFSYGPSDIGIGAEAVIDVSLDAEGLVTAIDVLRYSPDSDDGRRIALAAAQAVEACSPYSGGVLGGVVTIGPDVVYDDASNSIITMPATADGLDHSLGDDIQKIIEGR